MDPWPDINSCQPTERCIFDGFHLDLFINMDPISFLVQPYSHVP